MTKSTALVPTERIESVILSVRGERVILDADLANLFGVPTKRLNEQVKRNADRFPADFMFQLTWEEANALRSQSATLKGDSTKRSRSQSATLKRGRNVKYRPHVFTEHGAIMAANVLNSARAIEASVYVVRAFVRLRQMLATHKELAQKLVELERRLDKNDESIWQVMAAIRSLMEPPDEKRKRIGFEPPAKKKTRKKAKS